MTLEQWESEGGYVPSEDVTIDEYPIMNHTERITNLVTGAMRAGFNEEFGYAVTQSFGPIPGQPGQVGVGWLLTITLRNPMLGYQDIAFVATIPGILPPDVAFTQTTQTLMQQCREQKDKLLRGEA